MRRILLASVVLAFAFSKLAFSAAAADTTPPTLISAIRHSTNLYEIFLTFSEKMDTNTTLEPTNYKVRTGTTENPVFDVYTPGNKALTTNVIVQLSSEAVMNKDWTIAIQNVSDVASNKIVAITNLITTVEELIISGSTWNYSDGAGANEANSAFYDNSWAQPDPDFFLNLNNISPFAVGWAPAGQFTSLCCWNNVTDTPYTSQTYYYRQWIPISGSLFSGTLNMRMVVDDGAVVYVNGKEVYRTNIAATVAQPVYTTLASGTGTPAALAATGGRVISLPGGAFKPGDNLIAVEVHNRLKAPADASSGFDFELIHTYTNRLTGPIRIVRQPQDTTVVEGTPASFDVQHEGNPPYKYVWSKNGTVIPGATNRILNLASVALTDNNALYSVKITGGTGASTAVTSSNAVLRVTTDTVAPTIVSALLDDSGTSITLTFSERMKVPAATTIANYTITNLLGETLAINAVTNADDTFKVFTLTPADPLKVNTRYIIVPKNLTDNAAVGNPIAKGTTVSIGATFTVVDLESQWRYYSLGTNPPVGASWTLDSYDDSSWPVGQSLFGFDDVPAPIPFSTALDVNDPNGKQLITYYFRKTFVGGGPITNGMTLTLSHIIDDGAVVYLNGKVAFRFNLSTANPVYGTFASPSVDNAALVENVKFPITNLVNGVNQLAVEVHQSAATSGDAAFAIQLDQTIPSVVSVVAANANPTVAITAPANNASITNGVAVNLTATAADSDGTVAKVEFFDGTTKLGEDTTSPYSFAWTPSVTAGAHTIRAVATDNAGATAEASVSVTVVDVAAPKLTVTRSTDGKTATITWTAAPGYTLQKATKLAPTADWTAVAGAVSPLSVSVTAGSHSYYRLTK